jgi:hypothetical protein
MVNYTKSFSEEFQEQNVELPWPILQLIKYLDSDSVNLCNIPLVYKVRMSDVADILVPAAITHWPAVTKSGSERSKTKMSMKIYEKCSYSAY